MSNIKARSLRGLTNLETKLQRMNMREFEEYAEIIEQQKAEGIVEVANGTPQRREFYIAHKFVVRERAETTKLSSLFPMWNKHRFLMKSFTGDIFSPFLS